MLITPRLTAESPCCMGPQVPSCSHPISRNVSPPSVPPSQWGKGINLNTDQEGEKEKGFNPVPPSREPGVYHSYSVQTPQPVYGGREHRPLEPSHRTLGGRRQRGLQVGVRCPVLPTLGTQAYSPIKHRPHSQVVIINNRASKALFSFSLHPN